MLRPRSPRLAACALASSALFLASCGSPPKPPTVDPANRRPANAAAAVELQACKGELVNTRLLLTEQARSADTTSQAVAQLAQQQARQQAALQAQAIAIEARQAGQASPALGNVVHVIRFAYGSSQVELPDDEAQALLDGARQAPLVLLRGRTDGTADSPGDSRIARQRAEAVRALLVRAGVDPQRIRTTWQAWGDTVADNDSPAGRALNRRVEIELYRAPPAVAGASRGEVAG